MPKGIGYGYKKMLARAGSKFSRTRVGKYLKESAIGADPKGTKRRTHAKKTGKGY